MRLISARDSTLPKKNKKISYLWKEGKNVNGKWYQHYFNEMDKEICLMWKAKPSQGFENKSTPLLSCDQSLTANVAALQTTRTSKISFSVG